MDTLKLLSEWQFIGLWRGFEAPDSLKRRTLDDMQAEVKAMRLPAVPAVRSAEIAAQNELAKLRLRSDVIRALVHFDGKMPEFKAMLAHYGLNKPEYTRQHRLLVEALSTRIQQRIEQIKHGILGQPFTLAFDHSNRVLDGYLDTIERLMTGNGTANDTLEVKSVVVGSNYTQPAVDNSGLLNQIGSAKTPGEQITVGRQMTWITFFGLTDNNGLSTTVTSAASTTAFDLASVTGLAIGDRCQIQTALGQVNATVTNISGSTVTIDTPAASVPAPSDVFIQGWGESGLKGNDDGTVQFTRSRFLDGGYIKTSTKSILIESSVTTRSVGS